MNNSNNTEMKHQDNTSVLPTEAKTNLNLTTSYKTFNVFVPIS